MTYTQNIGITKLVQGQSNAHVTVNEALDVVDKTLAGLLQLNLTGLTTRSLSGSESTHAILRVGASDVDCVVTIQAQAKFWVVVNASSRAVSFKASGQAVPVIVPAGLTKLMVCDGPSITLVS